jgi:hypothetical protein
MPSVTAWIARCALDFEPVGIYVGAGIAVFLVMVAMGLLLMPGALAASAALVGGR